jgi:FKBP-type peptidyl-prolyl cis-trans isomerase SlyD
MEKGTIVRVQYDAFADGELFDTTSAETAKTHNKYKEDAFYGPLPMILGAGRVVPGFDAALQKAEVGKEQEVDIAPDQGFGPRDAAKVETIALREFLKRDVEPEPGMRVEWEGKGRGTVVSVTAGRVRLDFNPMLAGKVLKYKFTVTEVVERPEEKVRAILDNDYGYGRGADFAVRVDGSLAELTLPDSCKFDPRWPVSKYVIVADLRRYAGITKIRLVEEYEPPEPPAEPLSEPPAPERAEEELTAEDRAEVERQLAARKRGA